jgi:hypothetical protein
VEEIEGDKGVIIRVALLPMAKDAPGMKGYRSRNEDGQLREKRGDTHIGTIERQYGVDFGVRDDMHLDTLLEQRGISSLNDLLHGK